MLLGPQRLPGPKAEEKDVVRVRAGPEGPRPCLSLRAGPGLHKGLRLGPSGVPSLGTETEAVGSPQSPATARGPRGTSVAELVHTLDCAECGMKVTMPGVVWETTGMASLCFL